MLDKWFIVINPKAGKRKANQAWQALEQSLRLQDIPFEDVLSEDVLALKTIIEQALSDGFRKFVGVGGDGHLHHIVNVLMNQNLVNTKKLTITNFSVGTGNDWVRSHKIPNNPDAFASMLKNYVSYLHNVGKVTYYDSSVEKTRYFINIAGVGFDAVVVQNTQGDGGKYKYLFGLYKSIITFKTSLIKTILDDAELNYQNYMTIMCVCKYAGGGMLFAPKAEFDSDKFNVLCFGNINKLKAILNTKLLYMGELDKLKEANYYFSKTASISQPSNATPIRLEADGELLGSGPFRFELIEKAILIAALP